MSYLIPQCLLTERLFLRKFRESDFTAIHDYYSDEECTRYTTFRPLQEFESWQKLAALLGHWQLRHYGSYALEERTSGKVIGLAGLDYPYDWPEPEIQWGLARAWWGKGFASEAVRAIKRMTALYLPELPLISLIHPNNINSSNLAKATGAVFEKEILFRGDTWHIYRH